MSNIPIYTSEPMATRALAAEIRHAPEGFAQFLAQLIGVATLGDFQSVQCEAAERLDLELKFTGMQNLTIGIEAKFDHELTRSQVDRQLKVVDQLIILLASRGSAPEWLEALPLVSVITWKDALDCFIEPRLTADDIASISVLKSTVEALFRSQQLGKLRSEGWDIDVRRGGSGMPSIVIESAVLPNGRTLRGQIQISGRGMPKSGEPVKVEYSIGVSVAATTGEYPDPMLPHTEPGWIEPLRALNREVLQGEENRLLVSMRKPGNGRSELGKRKVPLAEEYLAGATWLAKGYTDGWALGIKSVNRSLDELEELTSITVEIFRRWYTVELTRTTPLP